MEEIKSRRDFLAQMDKFGVGNQYRTQVEAEIYGKVDEMENVDRERAKKEEEWKKKTKHKQKLSGEIV